MRNVLPFKMLILLQSSPVASTQSSVCALLLGVTLWLPLYVEITVLPCCLCTRLPYLPVSTSSHACHNYFHSRTQACRNCLHINGSQERHCMNFLWSVTCLISPGRLKHVTLKFSPLLLCLLLRAVYSHVMMKSNLLCCTWLAYFGLFWPVLVIINSNLANHAPLITVARFCGKYWAGDWYAFLSDVCAC